MYDVIRTKFFLKMGFDASFLEDDRSNFFLRGDGTSFQKLEFKKLSSELGIDVTSFEFRKMSSTWGQTHPDIAIRNAESATLQHSQVVANTFYHVAKQIQPMKYVQTYTKENNAFPSKLQQLVNDDYKVLHPAIKEKEKMRSKRRIENLEREKEALKDEMYENRSLSVHNKIRSCDRNYFVQLVEEVSGQKIEELVSKMKLYDWRDLLVRIVCMADGDTGNQLRFMWSKMYKVLHFLLSISIKVYIARETLSLEL